MKDYFIQYQPFLLFLAKFFLTYLVLTYVYQTYLSQFDSKKNQVDSFTTLVANQSKAVLLLFNDQTYTLPNPKEPNIKLYYHNQWVARIVEGCNALSIIILFVSFVIAFTGSVKNTFVFIVLGALIIHFSNVFRIALLCFSVYHYPQYESILHGVVFPFIIYGMVFLLWIVWVNKFSNGKKVAKK